MQKLFKFNYYVLNYIDLKFCKHLILQFVRRIEMFDIVSYFF